MGIKGQVAFEFLLSLNSLMLILTVVLVLVSSMVFYNHSNYNDLEKSIVCDKLINKLYFTERFKINESLNVPFTIEALSPNLIVLDRYYCYLPFNVSNDYVDTSPGKVYILINNKKLVISR